MTDVMNAYFEYGTNHLMILPRIRSISNPRLRRMDDLSSVTILAIHSVPLICYLRNLERI